MSIFKNPEWDVQSSRYIIKVNTSDIYTYNEIRIESSGNLFKPVNTTNNELLKSIEQKLALDLCNEGKEWFASPIKPELFLKRVTHHFEMPSTFKNYGNRPLEFLWVPKTIYINQKTFEVSWVIDRFREINNIIPSNFIDFSDFSEELEEAPAKTIVIQENAELLENVEHEIPYDESQNRIDLDSSRALLKQRVRAARLRAAIATMKAEKLAEKYFRRYGSSIDLSEDNESELSFETELSEN